MGLKLFLKYYSQFLMMSLDWNLDNVYLKCTNFHVYIFSRILVDFAKYTQNFLLYNYRHKIYISRNTQKNAHNSAKFIESINNRSILIQYKSWPACFSIDLDRNISRISLDSAVFLFGAEI